jgi:hypothetical protein
MSKRPQPAPPPLELSLARRRPISFSKPGGSMVSACRKSSTGLVAAAAPEFICRPRPLAAVTTSAPALSARRQVRSSQPPYTTITSAAAEAQRTTAPIDPSSFKDGIITLIGRHTELRPPREAPVMRVFVTGSSPPCALTPVAGLLTSPRGRKTMVHYSRDRKRSSGDRG